MYRIYSGEPLIGNTPTANPVMPAQAGIQESRALAYTVHWIPACAGMTVETVDVSYLRLDAIRLATRVPSKQKARCFHRAFLLQSGEPD